MLNHVMIGCTDVEKTKTFYNAVLGVLAVSVLLLGLWPAPLLEVMGPTIDHLVELMTRSKL